MVKFDFDLIVINSPQDCIFNAIFNHFKKLAIKNQKSKPTTSSAAVKRRNSTLSIEAPVDLNKRMRHFFDEGHKLMTNGCSFPSSSSTGEQKKFVKHEFDSPPLAASNNNVCCFVENFVGSIVEFNEGFTFCITSGDVFVHNHPAKDDCAYGIKSTAYYSSLQAVLVTKSYMGQSEYTELSIMWGYSELLVIGCFYVKKSTNAIHVSSASSTESRSTTPSTLTSSSSGSSSSKNYRLSLEEKSAIDSSFSSLTSFWKLSDGCVTEGEMRKFANNRNYEYPACSLILGTSDENWFKTSSTIQLNEIISHNSVQLPIFPEVYKNFLNQLKEECNNPGKLYQKASTIFIELGDDPMKLWLKDTVCETAKLFYYKQLPFLPLFPKHLSYMLPGSFV